MAALGRLEDRINGQPAAATLIGRSYIFAYFYV
jgi:hypothetical protein